MKQKRHPLPEVTFDHEASAVYVRLTREPSMKTVDVENAVVMADYDKDGGLIGYEILLPPEEH